MNNYGINRRYRLYRGKIYVSLFWFALGTFFLLNLGGWLFYLTTNIYLEKEVGERLSTIASLVSQFVEKNNFSYSHILSNLKGIRGICIWSKDNKEIIGEVDEETWSFLDEDEIRDAWNGKATYTPLYRVGNKLYKRGYAPVYSNGKVSGIIGVEGDVSMLKTLYGTKKTLFLSSLVSVFLVFLLFSLPKRFLNRYFSLLEEIEFQDKLSRLGDMASSLLHEIGNPLGIMQTTIEALKEEKNPEERGKLISSLEEEIERLSKRTRSFLFTEKVEEIDIKKFIQGFIPEWEKNLLKENILLSIKIGEGKFQWKGSKEDLREILQNLLQNARESIKGKGGIFINLESKKNFYVISVKDTGEGMDRKTREKIFTSFFTTKGEGRGLGLTRVKRIIENYGGKIKLKSKTKKGTEFIIYIPKDIV